MKIIRGWMLPLAAALASCGGGSGSTPGSTSAGDSGSYYPLAVGDRWVYQQSDSNTASSAVTHATALVKVSGTTTVNGTPALTVQLSNPATGTIQDEAHLAKTATALQRLYQSSDGAPESSEGMVTLLRLPVRSGDSYVAQDQSGIDLGVDLDGDGQNETLAIHTTVAVSGPESVTAPAGTYNDAMKAVSTSQRTITYSRNGAQAVAVIVSTEWLASGIGPVKIVQTYNVPTYTATTEYDLAEYNVDGQSSETNAPTVTQSSPAAGTTAGGGATISLALNELLDVTGTSTPVLTVLNGGQPVAGTFNYSNGTITFSPSQPLASGTYTATLSAATDAAGNTLAGAYAWSFTIDSVAPTVTATAPAANSTKIATDTAISIDFSKVMDPASLTTTSVTLSGGPANTLGITVTGSHVVLQPAAALGMNTTYTVTVGADVRDTLGNTLGTSYSFSFKTVPPRFLSYTATATGSSPEAVAIGDLDADGRNDVVMTTAYKNDPANDYKLLVFLQNSDGTLTAPVKYATASTYTCRASSVAIGDVTGDGKPDIVVGEGSCGIEIFQRQADGSWASGGVVASTNAQKIRIADVNNDGRLDVVGAGWATNSVTVWTQKAGGGLNTGTNYTLTHSGYEDMDVGDINGDGLNDIVVTSGQGSYTTSIAMLPQAAGGGFGTPAYYSTAGVNGSSFNNVAGVAVGDVNKDGRADIVVTIGGNSPNAKIGTLYQQADGSLAALTTLPSLDIPGPVEIADVDNDGRKDVVLAHNGWMKLGLYQQNGSGQLQSEQLFSIPYASSYNPNGLALGDINGDGYPDAVIADYNSGLVILYNSGP